MSNCEYQTDEAVVSDLGVGQGAGGSRAEAEPAGAGDRLGASQANSAPTVVVVGAGVSGCACAAALADAGVHVTLVNSAMDRVGLPAYGPDLVGELGEWSTLEEALRGLPSPLREVWLGASTRPANGGAILNIDRRRISVETKRLLERVPGLDFRQGFVTDLRILDPGCADVLPAANAVPPLETAPDGPAARRAQVETIFGEVFEADAVVVAAGLSLDGETVVGAADVQGGRYGEPSSEGLWGALRSLGAGFRETTVSIGGSMSTREATAGGWTPAGGGSGALPGAADLCGERLVSLEREGIVDCWPADYPCAPHLDDALRTGWIVMEPVARPGGKGTMGAPVLSPDGGIMGEVYVAPQSRLAGHLAGGREGEGSIVKTRMPMTVWAKVVTGLSVGGRVTLTGRPAPVWIVGRAGGASDYAASLASGVRAAADIVSLLGVGPAARTCGAVSPAGGWAVGRPGFSGGRPTPGRAGGENW